jgi:Right handed beta helix region
MLAASLCACADSATPAPASQEPGPIIPVNDAASFTAALSRAHAGTTIQLADGAYPRLTVEKRIFAGPVVIDGSRDARLAGIDFVHSANLVLKGVTVTPPANEAGTISITEGSRKIVVDGVLVDGRDEGVGGYVRSTDDTSDVTVQNSELTNCGFKGGCIRPGARNLSVIDNRFFDCRSCDFIKGSGNGALVRGNTFDLVHNVRCQGGPKFCPHNDHIHITGGGPWTIVGNRFGDQKEGAAMVYANPTIHEQARPIHDLLIASNLFTGVGGIAIRVGVGGKSPAPPPRNVRIVNNTVLSGLRGAVLLHDPWATVPAFKRPLVANNILSLVDAGNCGRGRFVSNLVLKGPSCPKDRTGNAYLDDKTDGPTGKSSLVVNRADPRYAPRTDFFGRPRNGRPDIGAIELQGR